MKRLFFIAIIAMSAALGAKASEAADSLARALATYWGSTVNTSRVPEGQLGEFVRGVADQLATNPAPASEAYMQGASVGRSLAQSLGQLKEFGIDVTPEAVAPYLISLLNGGAPFMTVSEAEACLDRAAGIQPDTVFTPEAQAAFIAAAAADEGAVTTPSGLVFQVITEGEGVMPVSGDDVRLTYTGRLSDGSVFDTTETPVTFSVDRLVPGFTEGLKLMRPGGTYRLVIPASLAYGDTGAGGGTIPPGAALDFTVNLLEVVPGSR